MSKQYDLLEMRLTPSSFHFGDWLVEPDTASLTRDGLSVRLDPRAMDVLTTLCREGGEVLSAEQLLRRCWPGIVVGENQVHKAIAQLRSALGDNTGEAIYIETIRKRGYRTIAPVLLAPGGTSVANSKDWANQSPFVGLESFDASHASVFFGRDGAISQVYGIVLAQERIGHCLVLLLGPSGSGKTSLVQAGLLPMLARSGAQVQVVTSTILDLGDLGGQALMTALGGALLDLDFNGEPVMAGQTATGIGIDLGRAPATIWAALGRVRTGNAVARHLIFIDRLEALFSLPDVDDVQRHGFLTALDGLGRCGAAIVLAACRNDFYPEIARQPILMEGRRNGAHYDLAPPSRAEIALMIRLPAATAGLRFGVDMSSQARLDDLLCEGAANSPSALPLLQYTLHELYLLRSPSGELTISAYQALGGIEGAIGRRAELVLEGLPIVSQEALPRILSLLVTLGVDQDIASSHRAPWSALRNQAEHALVSALVEQRLFVSLVADREPVFGVAHESLLSQWPRVTQWLNAHRLALKVRSRLTTVAAQWGADGRRSDRLLSRGRPLEEARELLDQGLIPLNDKVIDLIKASIRRVKRGDRLRLAAMVTFAVLSLVSILLALRALDAEEVAKQRRQKADDLMGFMVGEFADKLKPLGRLDLLDRVNGKAFQYLQSESTGNESPSGRLQYAQTLQTIAEVARARGDAVRATQALRLAETLLRMNLAQARNDPALLMTLGGVVFWLGQIDLDHGRYPQARMSFDEYLRLSEKLLSLRPGDADAMLEVAYANYNLGEWSLEQDEPASALLTYEKALLLETKVLKTRPQDRSLRAERAKSIGRVALVTRMLGRLPQAALHYRQQVDELQSLVDAAPSEGRWYALLASAKYTLATLMLAQGQSNEARSTLTTAVGLIQSALHVNQGNQLWQRERLVYEHRLALLNLHTGDRQHRIARLRDISAQLEDVLQHDPKNIYSIRSLATVKASWAAASLSLGHLDVATVQLNIVHEMLGKLFAEKQHASADRFGIADVLIMQGEIAMQQRRPSEAQRMCKQAIEIFGDNVGASADYELLDRWVRVNTCLGTRAEARVQELRLNQMGYRDPSYLAYLKAH